MLSTLSELSEKSLNLICKLTGRFDLKPLEVVKKLSIVVTPSITLAGTAFHSIQKVTKLDVTRMIPRTRLINKHAF